jgi:hypothetical protein
MAPRIEIKGNRLLIVEGADAYYFHVWGCRAFGATDVQVLNCGGITELRNYLRTLAMLPNFEAVETIVVGRDAEQDPQAAVRSIKGALRDAGLPVPGKPFEFAGKVPRTAFMIFPGCTTTESGRKHLAKGTLEDLCLSIIEDGVALQCVDQYMECLKSNGLAVTHPHKTRLHAYLAGNSDYVGLKIGEAAKAGAWNWQHANLDRFRKIVTSM